MNYWTGKIQDIDVPGPNDRIFTLDIAKSIVDQFKLQQLVGTSMLGTMINDWNYGQYKSQDVTHKVSDMWILEGGIWATVLIYPQGKGAMLSKVLETPDRASFVLVGDGEILTVKEHKFVQNYRLQSVVGVLL